MQVADYVVEELIKYGVTDVFGIPGGVVLKLLYAFQSRMPEITPHLNMHEQMAGFAACGYAQKSGRLGVAYATRGPGITNMVTCMAEAYQEALPVLFITAHGSRTENSMRFENAQELDLTKCVSEFTKLAVNIDKEEDVAEAFHKACDAAISGRKGPVFLDFSASLFDREMQIDLKNYNVCPIVLNNANDQGKEALLSIKKKLSFSKRPVVLIGDGLRHSLPQENLCEIAEKIRIPVLSSRGAQDLLSGSSYYYGYIGSHGTRYSNFILSKADLIIAVGNRLAFPVDSESFRPIIKNAEIVRLDIDETEFSRIIPGSHNYIVDVRVLLDELLKKEICVPDYSDWIETCRYLKNSLEIYDCPDPVNKLGNFLRTQNTQKVYVCDVGNNEFWFARAFEKERPKGEVLYSKAFGTLGVALGRAIGAYYASGKDVVCIMGDQGFQYNIQELQFIAEWNIPIKIILLNNYSSGMIADCEKRLFGENLVHVNSDTGYTVPDIKRIVNAYGIEYTDSLSVASDNTKGTKPLLYEIKCDGAIGLIPSLPKGNACQDMEPSLEREFYSYLNNLGVEA